MTETTHTDISPVVAAAIAAARECPRPEYRYIDKVSETRFLSDPSVRTAEEMWLVFLRGNVFGDWQKASLAAALSLLSDAGHILIKPGYPPETGVPVPYDRDYWIKETMFWATRHCPSTP